MPPSTKGTAGWGGREFGANRPFLQYIRAGDMLPRLFWFYRLVPEQWILDLIHKVYAKAWQPVDAVIPDEEWPKNRFDEMYAVKKADTGQQ